MAVLKYWDANSEVWVNVGANLTGAVPSTRTVNGKALSTNITLNASDVSAVPLTRTVNGKALSSNIVLTSEDVSAVNYGTFPILVTNQFTYATLIDFTFALSGDVTLYLPPASAAVGKVYNIKKTDTAGTTITIQADGSDIIDDANTKTITVQFTTITVQSDGTQWWTI